MKEILISNFITWVHCWKSKLKLLKLPDLTLHGFNFLSKPQKYTRTVTYQLCFQKGQSESNLYQIQNTQIKMLCLPHAVLKLVKVAFQLWIILCPGSTVKWTSPVCHSPSGPGWNLHELAHNFHHINKHFWWFLHISPVSVIISLELSDVLFWLFI